MAFSLGKRGKINILGFFLPFVVWAWGIESMERRHPPKHSSVWKHWDAWPRLGAGLEDMQEKQCMQSQKSRFPDFSQLQLNRLNCDTPYRKREGSDVIFFFYSTQTTCSLWLERKRETKRKLSLICECKNKKLDLGWGVPARLWNPSLCMNVDDFFWANHSVEMRHESHLDWCDLRHYIWLSNSDLKPKQVFWL